MNTLSMHRFSMAIGTIEICHYFGHFQNARYQLNTMFKSAPDLTAALKSLIRSDLQGFIEDES
jgi:hypothetical protein